jgi:sec-independent protein translocase protein TatB
MFGMGGSEIIVILIVALLFLGPEKLPQAAKQISKGIRDIKKSSRALQQQIESDDQIGGAIRDLKSALRGEDEPVRPKKKKPKPLPAAEENSILPPGDAPSLETAEAKAAADEQPVEAAQPAPPAEPVAEAAEPAVKLPVTAGEPDVHAPQANEGDDELAAMVRPVTGTVAKGSEPKHG